jgi:hypothetical protein
MSWAGGLLTTSNTFVNEAGTTSITLPALFPEYIGRDLWAFTLAPTGRTLTSVSSGTVDGSPAGGMTVIDTRTRGGYTAQVWFRAGTSDPPETFGYQWTFGALSGAEATDYVFATGYQFHQYDAVAWATDDWSGGLPHVLPALTLPTTAPTTRWRYQAAAGVFGASGSAPGSPPVVSSAPLAGGASSGYFSGTGIEATGTVAQTDTLAYADLPLSGWTVDESGVTWSYGFAFIIAVALDNPPDVVSGWHVGQVGFGGAW